MNLGMPASKIRMPFLSASFNKFQLNDWVAARVIFKLLKVPPLEITTTNKRVIESVLSNQFYHLQ